MFDWRREAVSSDPEYYKWSQWFFSQLFKHGLAYRKMSPVDWCPNCNTTLAREQVWGEDRHCERCGTPVIKKNLRQWFFRITDYAEELLDFSQIDWPERVKTLQTNWIGKSTGAAVVFRTEQGDPLEVFTTRPDTLWGATFMVLAPEHPLVKKITTAEEREAVEEYARNAVRQTDIQRESAEKDKTGVFTGGYALNPVNGEKIPVWIADYVLLGYGTGAVMGVPAHDQRDYEFAHDHDIPVVPVILPPDADTAGGDRWTEAYPGHGVMVNSGEYDRLASEIAGARICEALKSRQAGGPVVNYRMRDWLISRQRYWGTPIPIVYCPEHGAVPVPDEQLPILLPDDVEWLPTGESPLKLHPTWKNTTCPVCQRPAVRETDTMDTFMCSSWYHQRYLSPDYDQGMFDPAEYDYWMPVDTYTGGIEHATMHLIYTRFFHKAGRDMGIMEGSEPMAQLRNQGIILGEDSEKMSKSRGNVIAPDKLVARYGADTVRAYLMFFARWDLGGPWNSSGIEGSVRWIRRVWNLFTEPAQPGTLNPETTRNLRRKLHQTLRQVTHDFETFEFNTIISALMELLNEMYKARENGASGTEVWDEAQDIYLRMLAPVAPHVAEELWAYLGMPYSIHNQSWPEVDEAAAAEEQITLVVQVNGKVRDRISVSVDISEEKAKKLALSSEAVEKYLQGKEPRKVILVPGKLVNIVV